VRIADELPASQRGRLDLLDEPAYDVFDRPDADLGSGDLLMEPNDAYLCVVPGGAAPGGRHRRHRRVHHPPAHRLTAPAG
jgi:hypothetical protein